jgi:hypothetical protein
MYSLQVAYARNLTLQLYCFQTVNSMTTRGATCGVHAGKALFIRDIIMLVSYKVNIVFNYPEISESWMNSY